MRNSWSVSVHARIALGCVISGIAVTAAEMSGIVGLAAAAAAVGAWVTARLSFAPVRVLADAAAKLAGGDFEAAVPEPSSRDPLAAFARSVGALREEARNAYLMGQMIEQTPVGLLTAEKSGKLRVTYANPEALTVLAEMAARTDGKPPRLEGKSIEALSASPERLRAAIADASGLPWHERRSLGGQTIDVRIGALRDIKGRYTGPLITVASRTRQAALVGRFEATIGAVARATEEAARGMQGAAETLRGSAASSGIRAGAIAGGSDRAASNVQSVAAGAEQLAASINEISRQVTECARVSAQAVAETRATDASVNSLSAATARIESVVRLIGEIAGRTNLLALNATIEAARAGDAGKGFAIVAGEVKTLATQTSRATEEIASQIAAMQAASGQAVAALQGITGVIGTLEGIATSIAGAVEQQGAATAEIARAAQQAAAATVDVSANIGGVTEALTLTSTRAEDVMQAATELSAHAETLRRESDAFLVDVQDAA